MFNASKRLALQATQYEARITEIKASHEREVHALLDRISDLRSLALPPATSPGYVPVLQAEADALMTPGVNESIEMTPEQQAEWEKITSEADSLLNASY